jgi:hypothetical protein
LGVIHLAACACGCGQEIPPNKGMGRPRKYLPEHSPDKRKRPEKRQPTVLKLHGGPEAPAAPLTDGPAPAGVTAATLRRLEAAERLSTPEGAVALHLARLIDQGDYNAQGAAALAKAHAEALARATAGAKSAPDAIDELLERRAQRRGA